MKTLFPLSLLHKNSSKPKKNIQESYSSLLMSVSVTKDLILSFFISENRIRGAVWGSRYDLHEGNESDNGTSMWDAVTMRMQLMVLSTHEIHLRHSYKNRRTSTHFR